jgi:hypothetical protein
MPDFTDDGGQFSRRELVELLSVAISTDQKSVLENQCLGLVHRTSLRYPRGIIDVVAGLHVDRAGTLLHWRSTTLPGRKRLPPFGADDRSSNLELCNVTESGFVTLSLRHQLQVAFSSKHQTMFPKNDIFGGPGALPQYIGDSTRKGYMIVCNCRTV